MKANKVVHSFQLIFGVYLFGTTSLSFKFHFSLQSLTGWLAHSSHSLALGSVMCVLNLSLVNLGHSRVPCLWVKSTPKACLFSLSLQVSNGSKMSKKHTIFRLGQYKFSVRLGRVAKVRWSNIIQLAGRKLDWVRGRKHASFTDTRVKEKGHSRDIGTFS